MFVHISLSTCGLGAVNLREFGLVDPFGRAQSELMSVASTGFDRRRRNGFLYPVLKHGPRSLTYVRVLGWRNPRARGPDPPRRVAPSHGRTWQRRQRGRNESDRWEPARGHHRPIMIFGERFESEHTCWDPKDGELCLSRAKPGETLVEARSDSNVQIDRRTWV